MPCAQEMLGHVAAPFPWRRRRAAHRDAERRDASSVEDRRAVRQDHKGLLDLHSSPFCGFSTKTLARSLHAVGMQERTVKAELTSLNAIGNVTLGFLVVVCGELLWTSERDAREERQRGRAVRFYLFLAVVNRSQEQLREGRGTGCLIEQPGTGNLPNASFPSFLLVIFEQGKNKVVMK